MQNQKLFVRRDAHTHTARRVKSQKMDYMPEKRETQSEQRCADKPSHAKPSQTQQILNEQEFDKCCLGYILQLNAVCVR